MRRLTHALLALAGVIMGTGVAVAASVLHLSGWKASAGKPETFTITRVGGNGPATVTFTTTDGTATAPIDYTAASQTISWRNGQSTMAITVPTFINMAKAGQNIAFTATISGYGGTSSATGLIAEPAAPITPPPPTPTPTQAEPVPTVDLTGGASTADNFNTADGICDHNNAGAVSPAPCGWVGATGPSPDDMGNFRMICGAGQIGYNDPIVYPGQPGASHLHQFFGNLGADANSTAQSLRSSGGTTCGDPAAGIGVNRSGYWMPAMLDGAGHVVVPEYVAIYYKRQPASSPYCTPGNPNFIGICVGIPTGIRFITGYNMISGNQGDAHPFYYCQSSDIPGVNVTTPPVVLESDMPSVIPVCPIGARLTLNMAGPDCWDGKNLDVADHRSHIAHGAYVWDAATNLSVYRCDAAHPYHMPQMSIMAFYPVDANFEAGKWHLSSDEMVPGAVPGSTFHTDYWEAWSPTARQTWQQFCIDGHEQCAGGDLGNGTSIKGMVVPNTFALVPVPSKP